MGYKLTCKTHHHVNIQYYELQARNYEHISKLTSGHLN
jgi:hypothetical protein